MVGQFAGHGAQPNKDTHGYQNGHPQIDVCRGLGGDPASLGTQFSVNSESPLYSTHSNLSNTGRISPRLIYRDHSCDVVFPSMT